MARAALDEVNDMGQQVDDGFERLDGALRAAGQVHNDDALADAADGARERCGASFLDAFQAHQFGKAGDFALDDGAGGFRRHIARGKARASGGEDAVAIALIRLSYETVSYLLKFVGEDLNGLDHPSVGFKNAAHCGAGAVFALAARGGVTQDEDMRAES